MDFQSTQKIERLPDLPTVSKRDEMLVDRRHHLQKAWECSPCYIEKTKAKTGRGRGRGVLPPGSTPWLLQSSLAKTDLLRFDQLATPEQRRQKDEEKGDKDVEEKKLGEGEEGDGENEELEDEEEKLGDDDYAQVYATPELIALDPIAATVSSSKAICKPFVTHSLTISGALAHLQSLLRAFVMRKTHFPYTFELQEERKGHLARSPVLLINAALWQNFEHPNFSFLCCTICGVPMMHSQ